MKPLKFLDQFRDAMLLGRKTVTRRPLKPQPKSVFRNSPVNTYLFDGEAESCAYGDRGDTFTAFGVDFEILAVSVERLHDYSRNDPLLEGFDDDEGQNARRFAWEKFVEAWDAIYSAKGFGWDTNPWVWRIEFKRKEVKK